MSHRQKKLHIPQRVSSASASPGGSSSRHSSREKLHTTANGMYDDDYSSQDSVPVCRTNEDESRLASPRNRRDTADRVVLSTITEASTPNDTSSSGADRHLHPDLRQRASSPLLGQSYKRNRAVSPASVQPLPKPMRVTGSSSTLHSFYDPHQSLPPSSGHDTAITDPGDIDLRDNEPAPPPPPPTSKSASDLNSRYRTMDPVHHKDRRTSSTAKLRPMFDLSKLFPKHRDPSPRLLSPTRMVASPSPVSMVSDDAPNKTAHGPKSFGKFTKPQGKNESLLLRRRQKEQQQQLQREREEAEEQQRQLKEQREREQREHFERQVPKPLRPPTRTFWNRREAFANWFDGPLGQVSDGEEEGDDSDVDMDTESQHRLRTPADNNRTFCESRSPSVRSDQPSAVSAASSRTVRFSSGGSTIKPHRSTPPNSIKIRSGTVKSHSTLNESERSDSPHYRERRAKPPSINPSINKGGFDNSNLNESSVLCLSSEDEEEAKEEDATQKTGNRTFVRDSIATFDEGEICTAKAAVATTRRPSIRSVKPNGNSQNKGSPRSLEFHLPRPRSGGSGRQTPDRRSRVLSLTRQEEHLIEVIRRHKGPIPSASFNDNESIASSNPDGNASSAPRQGAAAGANSDVSFLKLGPGSQSKSRRRRRHSNSHNHNPNGSGNNDGNGSTESEDSVSQLRESGTGTDNSGASPRASLVHSDALPSPSTGLTSPRTPTMLPGPQRFSLQQSPPNPPPNFSPPPIPAQPPSHSRTRTDSSSALIFNNTEGSEKDMEPSPDLPIWALGWNQELGGMAVAH